MSDFDGYFPDYEKLYPEIKSRPDILEVLRASDQKMKYAEYDLKTGRFLVDLEHQTTEFLPSREDSLERIMEEEKRDFMDPNDGVEDQVLCRERYDFLYRAIDFLKNEERSLIIGLYFQDKTESTYASEHGLSQKAVNKRRKKVLLKLKKILLRTFVEVVLKCLS